MTQIELGVRRFGRTNWLGLYTLFHREVQRFTAIWMQTLIAPLVTAGLFLMIFNIAIGPTRGEVMGTSFINFIAPGLMMMTVIQNAFANTSSSIIGSKVQGNIVDTLMPPLSPLELVLGYTVGGVLRGIFVAMPIALGLYLYFGLVPDNILIMIAFVIFGSALMGVMGIVAGIIAQKFDQLAAITNFVVTPLAFLSGTFYSVQSMPAGLRELTHVNPVFYIIDGGRHGMLGVSDSNPLLGLTVILGCTFLVGWISWEMVRRGYRLKS